MSKGICSQCGEGVMGEVHKRACGAKTRYKICVDCGGTKPATIHERCRSCAAKWRHRNLPGYTKKVMNPEIREKQLATKVVRRAADPHYGRPNLGRDLRGTKQRMPEAWYQKLREGGIRNRKPGGNGRISWRQEKLWQALGEPWQNEYVIKTGELRPYPPAYKIDIAQLDLKIAIEVGNWPSPRKAEWYKANGWTLLHFSNRMVELVVEDCLATVRSTISQLQTTTIM